ncbi:tol-pal system protein YbgF [Desulfomicrobium norvegicum]|uniref:Tol-pal system protein YbgF n=1 Tax=Desulfomicrobium norvegicum (strain DSM 1741 / NCIMB 8310) TaxID=52561 RepID=A0A8G2F648_DESNO|nr:tol-pal system protein YbgF [Desulfomicrobium norvegicum]SFL77092.1 tol-pal system protein YbgF [Desulfomicrobium norvegicum]
MRSTLAFVIGMLVGILLSWASGPVLMHFARDWPGFNLADMPASIVAGLKTMQDGRAPVGRPSASVLRVPVTRKLRMARSGVILGREVAIPSNATVARFSVVPHAYPASSTVAINASADSDSNSSAASGPGPVHVARGAHESSVSGPDIFQPGPGASGLGASGPEVPAADVSPAKVSDPGASAPGQAPGVSPSVLKKKTAPETSPDEDYARALKSYQNGRHAPARELFAAFMRKFPSHRLIPNALYWTGETWYAQGRYDRAMEFFARVVRDHPRHAKSADALLKLAYSELRQGRPAQAGAYLQQLESRYPDSPASRLGRQARGRIQGCNEPNAVALARG